VQARGIEAEPPKRQAKRSREGDAADSPTRGVGARSAANDEAARPNYDSLATKQKARKYMNIKYLRAFIYNYLRSIKPHQRRK
jgi:hypothetical protein